MTTVFFVGGASSFVGGAIVRRHAGAGEQPATAATLQHMVQAGKVLGYRVVTV